MFKFEIKNEAIRQNMGTHVFAAVRRDDRVVGAAAAALCTLHGLSADVGRRRSVAQLLALGLWWWESDAKESVGKHELTTCIINSQAGCLKAEMS
jgi:hypothetical protein